MVLSLACEIHPLYLPLLLLVVILIIKVCENLLNPKKKLRWLAVHFAIAFRYHKNSRKSFFSFLPQDKRAKRAECRQGKSHIQEIERRRRLFALS